MINKGRILIFYTLIILLIAYITYFQNYTYPSSMVWDEHYHITAAIKYFNSVMFMDAHSPLGKMFVSLGEYIFQGNKDKEWFELNYGIVEDLKKELKDKKKSDSLNELIGQEWEKEKFLNILKEKGFTEKEIDIIHSKAKKINISYLLCSDNVIGVPKGFSFAGWRFFPVLFGALSSVLFFYILYFISNNCHLSFLFSFLYLFDNGIILNCRIAILEGIQIFFLLLAVFFFIYKIRKEKRLKRWDYLIIGLMIGTLILVKENGAVIVLFFIFMLLNDFKERNTFSFKDLILKICLFTGGFVFVFILIFYIHFALGKNIVNNNTYGASVKYMDIIKKGKTSDIRNFPVMIKDYCSYLVIFHSKVPPGNYNSSRETGSYPLLWPLGGKGIFYYRNNMDDKIQCLYFQGNPIIWFTGLISIPLSIIILVRTYIFKKPVKNRKLLNFITYFLTVYIFYMSLMLMLKRVVYLYHYLVPLLFTLILSFLVFNYIFEEHIHGKNKFIYIIPGILCIFIIIAYWYYSPLTYYIPMAQSELPGKMWFNWLFSKL